MQQKSQFYNKNFKKLKIPGVFQKSLFSGLVHTLSWELMIERWLKSFWQSIQKKWQEGKKEKKLERQLQSFLH